RLAVVYVRQSTPRQIIEHRESTELQYNLTRRAMELGWRQDRLLVIDDDLGQSGTTAAHRAGFQRLLAEVAMNHVGIVIGMEMSRLARSNKDWHHLLELCGVFRALLADQDGLYDPCDFNDRLLLGLKGAMSEAELHIIRARMDQGRRNKAERGELFSLAPIGYIRLPSGELDMDPDEQVQTAVRMVFEKFAELGSARQVAHYLVTHRIRIPVRPHSGSNRGQLEWRRPQPETIYGLLHHPFYAGAYGYGRIRIDPRRKIPGRPSTGRIVVPMEQWQVLRKDAVPAYITWDEYLANQQRLRQNRARFDTIGVPRAGTSLLAGLVRCGKCGRRMHVSYPGQPSAAHYVCQRGDPTDRCESQNLAAWSVEELVERQVLSALQPAALELNLNAAADLQRGRRRLDKYWQCRLDRARYATERAARQFQSVEPEHRLVARELERRWEQTLAEERQIQEEYDRFQGGCAADLSDQDRERIRDLSSDIPALWALPSTAVQDRQEVIRFLIESVTLEVQGKSENVDLTIHWVGGFVSQHEVRRSVGRYEQLHDYDRLTARLKALRNEGHTSARIAAQLNEEGFHTPRGKRKLFTGVLVRALLSRLGLSRSRETPDGCEPDEWWAHDLCRKLDVPFGTLKGWIQFGWVHARKSQLGAERWLVWADSAERDRLLRLRSYRRQPGVAYPPELTTPKAKGNP
ncbi:MAG: recombinase family protein, partial [Planctomycetaceae bacterium]|nr:recombinase family protein [Planctomycetaceae bacterium]